MEAPTLTGTSSAPPSRVRLSADGSNVAQFLDGLFDPPPGMFGPNVDPLTLVRGSLAAQIRHAEEGYFSDDDELGALEAAREEMPLRVVFLMSDDELGTIKAALRAAWNGGRLADSDGSDARFIKVVRDYCTGGVPFSLWVPRMRCIDVPEKGPARYCLEGYQEHPFGSAATLDVFFELLLAGAHFVVIHSAKDLGSIRPPLNPMPGDFYASLTSSLKCRKAAGHSHYAAVVSGASPWGKAMVYPSLAQNDDETLKLEQGQPAPYLAAILIDRTAHNYHNTFFQLEGWPAFGGTSTAVAQVPSWSTRQQLKFSGGYRHGGDFKTHGDTNWNIATYGACAYSEKRGGTVFIAPNAWKPEPQPQTIMAPYVGAESKQRWLKQNLISVCPTGAARVEKRGAKNQQQLGLETRD